MRRLNIDIETYSSVDLKKCGLAAYVESPDFEILLFAVSKDGGDVYMYDLAQGENIPPHIVWDLADPNVEKHAFNATFEWRCLSMKYKTYIEQWRCSMFHSLYCGLAGSLAGAGTAVGLPPDKAKMGAGMALIRTFCMPVKPTKANGQKTRMRAADAPEKWEQFKEYCKQDVVAEMALGDKLKAFPIPALEQENWVISETINQNGVAIDKDLVDSAIFCDTEYSEALMNEAMEITGLENPKSRNQMLAWLSTACGETVDDLTKATVVRMLGDGALSTSVQRVLEIRQEISKTSIAKYSAMNRVLCRDGRVRGMFQFYGANRSGRWAGRLIQLQNLPRNYIEPLGYARELVKARNIEALKIIYGSVPNTLSQLTRTAFIPPKGRVYVVADFSAIEARVLAWVANERWVMDVFAGEGKIYEACASSMFNVPMDTIVKGGTNYDLRAKGKVATLACGYQGSVGALRAMGADETMTDDDLKDIVNKWRTANPNIVQFWYDCQKAAVQVIRSGKESTVAGKLIFRREFNFEHKLDFMTIELPAGRKLYYAFPSLGVNKWGGDSIEYMGMNQTTRKWAKVESYGGKLAENVTQAIARDCLTHSMAKLHKLGHEIVIHVHDEIVLSSTTDCLTEVCSIMGEPIPWAEGLVLTADGFVGDYYKKE